MIAALAPTSTPATLRQPAAFGTGSISVIDPDLQFPQVHEWFVGFQRELWKNNVLEVNYIGKHAVHLLGGYNVNQVNVFAGVPGVSENFLSAFNSIKASAAFNSPLINRLFTGNAANNAGTATFRTLASASIANGSAATAALNVSTKALSGGGCHSRVLWAAGQQLISADRRQPICVSAVPSVYRRAECF